MQGRIGSRAGEKAPLSTERRGVDIAEREPCSAVVANGQRHALFDDEGLFIHRWTDVNGREVLSLSSQEAAEAAVSFVDVLLAGDPIRGAGQHELRFNVSERYARARRADLGLDKANAERAGDGLCVRADGSDHRFLLDFSFRPEMGRLGDYVITRLNSKGSRSVPEMVGFSYWDIEGNPLIWARMLRREPGSVPAMRPMLGDIDLLLKTIAPMETEEFRSAMISLSGGEDSEGLSLSYRLGGQIASLHSDMIIDGENRPHGSGKIGDRIVSALSVSRMTMGDAGSLLGKLGLYMVGLKREMVRLVGETPAGHRKQKVVKSSPRYEIFKSKGMEAIPMLARRLQARETSIRGRSSILKDLPGSPMIAGLLDTSLERSEFCDDRFVFGSFDWRFSGGGAEKVLPLKDLALSLNSLMKARYLSCRKHIRQISQATGTDQANLWLMFIEYNLSRPDYDDMRKDLSLRDLVRIRETPFKRVMTISMIGALWYELAQRRLVQGYVDGLNSSGKESLLGYPEGTDTLAAIRTMQILASLSELNSASGGASIPTLESDLMIVLTR